MTPAQDHTLSFAWSPAVVAIAGEMDFTARPQHQNSKTCALSGKRQVEGVKDTLRDHRLATRMTKKLIFEGIAEH